MDGNSHKIEDLAMNILSILLGIFAGLAAIEIVRILKYTFKEINRESEE